VKQFILSSEPEDGIVRFEGGDYRYLAKVRRLAAGEFFPALLPNGAETLVQVLSIDCGVLTGRCQIPDITVSDNTASGKAALSKADSSKPQLPPLILFQSLPKGEKMDLIVRQAAEGGITEIVPFVSEFSVAKTGAGGQKFSRWERIIKEARQQSGSKTATAIHRPLTIGGLFEYWKKLKADGALGLLFHHEVRQGLEKESLHRYLDSVPEIAAFAIGPEGGFSGREVSLFMENGFKSLTIGDTILRTETAALYCAAAVRILLLERNSWELKQAKTGSV
jgi:16S rRNA (uracil1498-N3)-methyltransferase